jgi:hypothetical protein
MIERLATIDRPADPSAVAPRSLTDLHPGLAVYQHHGGQLEDIAVHNRLQTPVDMPGEKIVYATPDSQGNVYATSILEETGQELTWRDHRETKRLDRQVLLTTETGRQYYVYGDRIFDINASIDGKDSVSEELPPDQPLPTVTVGEGWITPFGVTDPINKIEVVEQKVSAENASSLFESYTPAAGKGGIAELAEWIAPHQVGGYKKLPENPVGTKVALNQATVPLEAETFNTRSKDETYAPTADEIREMTLLSDQINVSEEGAIGYDLHGQKLNSHAVRSFLDNLNRNRQKQAGVTEPKIMSDEVLSGALSDFRDYANQSRPLSEELRKAGTLLKRIGQTALVKGVELTEIAGAKTKRRAQSVLAKGAETAKWANRRSKAALARAARRAAEIREATVDKLAKYGEKGKRWTADKYIEVGAFAVALQAEAPDIENLKEADKWLWLDKKEEYDSKNPLGKAAHKLAHISALKTVVVEEVRAADNKQQS